MSTRLFRNLSILVVTLFSVAGSLHAQVSNVSVSPTTLQGDGSYFAAASATVHVAAGSPGANVYFIPNGNVGGTAFCSSGRYADQQSQ